MMGRQADETNRTARVPPEERVLRRQHPGRQSTIGAAVEARAVAVAAADVATAGS